MQIKIIVWPLKIISSDPLQYISVDTAGVVMINELEKMMIFSNQDSTCIFSKTTGFNFVQLDILNQRYPKFLKRSQNGDPEMVIAYAASQFIIITTLEPVSKTTRILVKYPRPPIVFDGALPHICWYEHSRQDKAGQDHAPDRSEEPKSLNDLGDKF